MIELHNINLTIDTTSILKGISWSIKDAEKWVLFGKNGSGKTQLLKILSGYTHQTSGTLSRFGNDEIGTDLREIRKRIGYMSPYLKDRIPPDQTILDVILSGYFASFGLYEEVTREQCARAEELLLSVHMGHFRDRTFGTLSYGECQKIIILRSIIEKPDLLILDEPTMGLDILSREEFLDTLQTIGTTQNLAMIFVSHHVEEIIPLFSKICIIEQGNVLFQGAIDEAVEHNKIGELFNSQVEVVKKEDRFYSVLVRGIK